VIRGCGGLLEEDFYEKFVEERYRGTNDDDGVLGGCPHEQIGRRN